MTTTPPFQECLDDPAEEPTRSNWLTPAGNPTVKWRGHSIGKIRDALEGQGAAIAARGVIIHALDAQVDSFRDIVRGELAILLEVTAEELHLGRTPCPESPTLHCIYNLPEDPLKDFCLICYQPAERK